MVKKVLFIIAQQNFRDEELEIPKRILEENEIQATIASITKDEAVGMLGARIQPDITVRDANPDDYDALIVVGGSGSPKLADYPEVLSIIRRFDEQKKLIAAICLAPTVLAKAGILDGVTVTTYPTDWSIAVLQKHGANYIKEHVVVDGRIITADGPQSAEEFGRKILELLKKL
jgi:protease I